MSITKAKLADAAELAILVNSAYRGESSQKGWTSEAHLLGGIRVDEAEMIKYLLDPDTTILKYANKDGQIIGCVYLQVRGQKLYLGMLTVSPTLQTNGVGRQMLHEAELFAHQMNCHAIFMTVITTRYELIKWYERRGYHATGEIIPFPADTKFGIPKGAADIELALFEKEV